MDGGHWGQKLLSRIPHTTVTDSNAGCCSIVGSFGYEIEHAALSKQIAELGQRESIHTVQAIRKHIFLKKRSKSFYE